MNLKKFFTGFVAAVTMVTAVAAGSGGYTSFVNVPETVSAADGTVIFCSPSGTASAEGTKDAPMDVVTAISKVDEGGTIYLLGGTYKFDKTIKIANTNNGSAGKYKTIMPYLGADVVWDFSAMATADANKGLILDGNYWYIKNFEITKAGDNGLLVSGNNNRIELMQFSDNQDTGLQISRSSSSAATIDQWPSNNLILNCTSYNNCDDKTMENADGFAAKLTCGEGNVFDGCIAYNNSDDGWDLFAKEETGPIGVVTIRNCVAFRNGFTEFGEGFGDCDGNGFKLGGGGIGTPHVVENCLAFENLNAGFTDNNNPELASLTNCIAYNNGIGGNKKANFSCYRAKYNENNDPTKTNDGCAFKNILTYINEDKLSSSFPGGESNLILSNDTFAGTIENSLYYNTKYYNVTSKMEIAKGDKLGDVVTPTDDMFVSLDVPAYVQNSSYDFHTKWRNSDGSINTHGFCEVKEESEYAGLGAKFEAPQTKTKLEDINNAVLDTSYIYMIKNKNSKLYMDVTDGEAASGTNVQQWGANGAGTHNTWTFGGLTSQGYYNIISRLDDGQSYYLNVEGGNNADGKNVEIWDNNSESGTLFLFEENADGSYTIYTKASGNKYRVLDVADSGTNPGDNVLQKTSTNESSQRWVLEEVEKIPEPVVTTTTTTTTITTTTTTTTAVTTTTIKRAEIDLSKYYMIKNKKSGLFMEVADGTAEAGTNVQQNTADTDNPEAKNVWQIRYPKEDEIWDVYYIYSALSDDKSLVLNCGSKNDGENISIENKTSENVQYFFIMENDDGSYSILTRSSFNKGTEIYKSCIEVENGSTEIGANIQQMTRNDEDEQKWELIPVDYKIPVVTTVTTDVTTTTTTEVSTTTEAVTTTEVSTTTNVSTTTTSVTTTTVATTVTSVTTTVKGTLRGDINGDAQVNIADLVHMQKHLVKIITLDSDTLRRADLNSDKKVNIYDYIVLKKILMKISAK